MSDYEARLASLRHRLEGLGVNAFYLPLTDEYQGEYMPASARRLEWLTGFSGSAGSMVVATEPALTAFFTDGRYQIQAEMEVPPSVQRFNSGAESPEAYMARNFPKGAQIGYDPWLITLASRERMEKKLRGNDITLVALTPNPLDALWHRRPQEPADAIHIHPLEHAGEAFGEKCRRLAAELHEKNHDAAILTVCDSVMWLLNIRGSDVPMTPFARAYAILHADGTVDLFARDGQVTNEVADYFGADVRVHPNAALSQRIASLSGKQVLLDPKLSPVWFADALEKAGATRVRGDDPCQLPKAAKNAVEVEGMRRAHGRDGRAVIRFLAWLHEALSHRPVNELQVMEKLEAFRAASPEYRGPSFTTIAGAGPNGAIVHYRATEHSSRVLEQDSLLLLDSGGQYPDGTTDITRTVALGQPQPAMREDFTRVLQGHIALARAVFPAGTNGQQLDALARQPLWRAGADYDHGTGHGVGSYLSVHEGPQRISKKGSDTALLPGMLLSNEPGCYREGQYGIRIENLVVVQPCNDVEGFLEFETLTLVPIDRQLIIAEWLSGDEREWLNLYHARIWQAHKDELSGKERAWLEAACAPL